MFRVFEIIVFEHVTGISLTYDENTSDQQSTCYQKSPKISHLTKRSVF